MDYSESQEYDQLYKNHQNSLFQNDRFKQIASNISPRLEHIYQELSKLFESNIDVSKKEFQESINLILKCLTFEARVSNGPICNKVGAKKYFHCLNCRLSQLSVYCQDCFIEQLHKDHHFVIAYYQGQEESLTICDCGNTNILKKDSMCSLHRNFIASTFTNDIQLQKYIKQLQFLLYIGLRVNREFVYSPSKKGLIEYILNKTVEITSNSFIYQKKIADLILHPFPKEYYYEPRQIIQILNTQQWSIQMLKTINMMYVNLYPVSSARKRIFIGLIKIFSSFQRNKEELEQLFSIVYQFGQLNSSVLKLIQTNKVKPLVFLKIDNIDECYFRNQYILKWYKQFETYPLFPKFVELVLKKVDVRTFLYYPIYQHSEQDEETSKSLYQSYFILIKMLVKNIEKLQNKRQLLIKMIRQLFYIIFQKQQKTVKFCAEKMLGICMFSYFNHDLSEMNKLSGIQLKDLFGATEDLNSIRFQNILQFKLQKIQFLRDDNTTKQDIAITHSTFHVLFLLKLKLEKQRNENIILKTLRKIKYQSTNLKYKVKNNKNQLNTLQIDNQQEQNSNQNNPDQNNSDQNNASQQQQLCYLIQPYSKLIAKIIVIFQSEIHQILLASLLLEGKINKGSILQLYRQLAYIHFRKTPLQFRQECQQWIKNDQIWYEFMEKQFSNIRNGRQNKQLIAKYYWSGISFNSILCEAQEQLIITRLHLKNRISFFIKWNNEKQHLFSESVCQELIDYYRTACQKLNSSQINFEEQYQVSYFLTLTLTIFTGLYQYLKYQNLKQFLDYLLGININNQIYQDNIKILKNINKQFEIMKNQKEKGTKCSEKNLKKQKMMKLKEKQQKILSKNQFIPQENVQHACIVCKQIAPQKIMKYLCRIKFSSVLNQSIRKKTEPIIIITTCGHRIHQCCFEKSMQGNQQYVESYKCFLCQTISNFRMPIFTGPSTFRDTKEIIEEMFTILALQLQNNPSHNSVGQLKQELMPEYLIESLVNEIYLYYLSGYSHFEVKMLPLFIHQIFLIKSLIKPKSKKKSNKQKTKQIYNKEQQYIYSELKSIIDSSITNIQKIDEQIKKMIEMVSQNLKNKELSLIGFQNTKYNFFIFPDQLSQLTNISRKCTSCNQLQSRLTICFYCGLISCVDCRDKSNHQINFHNGSSPLIYIDKGQLYYQYESNCLRIDYLYKNCLGEGYSNSQYHNFPKKGVYKLDRKVYQRLIEDSLLQYVSDPNIEGQE